jgi:hypothetical protein
MIQTVIARVRFYCIAPTVLSMVLVEGQEKGLTFSLDSFVVTIEYLHIVVPHQPVLSKTE